MSSPTPVSYRATTAAAISYRATAAISYRATAPVSYRATAISYRAEATGLTPPPSYATTASSCSNYGWSYADKWACPRCVLGGSGLPSA